MPVAFAGAQLGELRIHTIRNHSTDAVQPNRDRFEPLRLAATAKELLNRP